MEVFPADFVVHNYPLLLLSGLDADKLTDAEVSGKAKTVLHEGGFRIKVDAPVVKGELAERVLQAFHAQDASRLEWHGQATALKNGRVFHIKTVGRVYTLPPRKAPPPPHSPRLSATVATGTPPPQLALHSPLSPLTPSSPLYPDGIISPLWITKHQSRLPSAFLTFFSLISDANTSSLHDNKLKTEIIHVKSALSTTNYKTKLAVVLLGDGIISLSELEERVTNIRRATGLDAKSLYCVASNSSPAEVADLVDTVLSSLHSQCVDYYRDLSKHARRKRSRNSVPQPTVQPTTSHVLSLQGWNARYEFKLGVFAEFRQEMDAACRNYEAAYESLFSPEIIDAIAVWSPRFNEARMLGDVIAFRVIRCLLWADQGMAAVRSWTGHRDRVMDLVNRRGKGTETYGWEAWQSTWAKVMADLLSRSKFPLLSTRLSDATKDIAIHAYSEKSLPPGERANPWEFLHHEGYWLNIAQEKMAGRRKLAHQIPEEDREPPGRSPASAIASKAHLYDGYLVLEPYRELPVDGSPGYDYTDEIIKSLDEAVNHFSKRGQLRMIEILEMKKAVEHIQAEAWTDAIEILEKIWSDRHWRQGGWWKLLQNLGWALLDCTARVKDQSLMIRLLWELSNNVFDHRPDKNYDFSSAVVQSQPGGSRPTVVLDTEETLSPLSSTFTFSSPGVFVGTPLECQFVVRSRAQASSPPIRLSEAKIVFEGNLKPIYLVAEQSEGDHATATSQDSFINVVLQDSSTLTAQANKRSSAGAVASLVGVTDLTIHSGQIKIFRLRVIPREAGDLRVASISLVVDDDNFRLAATTSKFDHTASHWWEVKDGLPVSRALGQESNARNSINVLPKPPKMLIEVPQLRKSYYTNEVINLDLNIVNEEDEETMASVEVRLISPVANSARIAWAGSLHEKSVAESDSGTATLAPQDLETIGPSDRKTVAVVISETMAAVDHELEILVTYNLKSEPETVLSKTLTVDLGVIRPFEANYDFVTRLDRELWPKFFEAPPAGTDSAKALGIRHHYSVTANVYSFASEAVTIEGILLTATKIVGGATCSSSTGIVKSLTNPESGPEEQVISTVIRPEQTEKFEFDLFVQKLVLGDRHTVGVELALEIAWRRLDSDQVNSSVLEVPQLVAPMAEPRVLLTATPIQLKSNVAMTRLDYMLENPSMHFLTFNITMDASEDFAFSGSKSRAVSLVPLSRETVTYRILTNTTDEWIGVHLNVVDAYFNQTLRVLPGGDRVRLDKKDNVLVQVL